VLTGTVDDAVTAAVRHECHRDTPDAAAGADERAPLIDLVGRTDLGELAEVLRRASVVCVGNTGPMHLAAAVGTPVVATFAPTVPLERWRPWLVPHVLLGRQEIECARCHLRECALPEQLCLSIDPHDVVAAARTLSSGVPVRRASPRGRVPVHAAGWCG
jgi:ADP-heptose:LPS heptosyltransferase